MEPIKLFVVEEKNVTHAYTEEMLNRIPVQVENSDGQVVTRYLGEPDVLKLCYPGGTWETVQLKNGLTYGDDLRAQSSLYRADSVTGQIVFQPWRERAAFASVAIREWTFQPSVEFPVSEAGIHALPPKVGALLVDLIWVRYNADPATFRTVVRAAG